MAKNGDKSVPAYIPFITFTNFIEALKNTTVPPRIDSTITPTMSGQSRGALNSALRFLGLVEGEQNAVGAPLKELVGAFGGLEWKNVLGQLITTAYGPIVKDLDISHATGGQLNEHFRAAGIDGQVLEKAVRFYLSALDEVGIPYSPLFKTRGARTVRKRTPPRTRPIAPGQQELDLENGEEEPPASPTEGLVTFLVPFPDKPWAKLWVPRDLSAEDWDLIDAIGRAYVKRTNKFKNETTNV
jgi:hypothetical protein